MKRKRGRPSLLDERLQKRLCKLLADANTISASCESLGISTTTYHAWRAKYPDFLAATTRARGQARIKLVKEIKRCSRDDWRGWSWLAERMFPGDFARTEPRVIVMQSPPVPPSPVPVEQPAETKRTVKFVVPNRDIFDAKQLRYFRNLRDHVVALNGNGDRHE